ncbi:hypothetical protein PR048_016445 [Dryococelus australis]|uniref:Exocyst complex component 3 n=1 Tax=Dryococelus australis TaxID=614101 RepID=A0ABQ9HKX2_9NEOP|nr:hypothetical protein PR048_016445 [Dryococelus australis]
MDVEQLELEAKATATKHVINMLQRPEQLEKVEQYKRRVARKKASVEAMLKTAMQSQLDGVRVGLNQLQSALHDIQDIKENLKWIEESFPLVPELSAKLQDVREENMRHSQYVTAMENLKHIFTVPESVAKTKHGILGRDNLYFAIQCLTDLENSRDDLLYELHKLPNQAPADKVMLKAYFEDVQALSDLLEKQLRLVLGRTLNTVRKEPTEIVTALRIIEREEKADAFALQRQRQSGFLAPGRPKKWREMAFSVLEKSVAQRIEGTQVDERDSNKMWLVRYLELTRQLILEDLRVVKTLCVPCFPPQYDIINKFVHMYHSSLSAHLQELIQSGLEGNEFVSLLSWIMNTYSGLELMQHPELNIDTTSVGPLLSNSIVEELQGQYLKNMENNYMEWMQKTLEKEKEDWRKQVLPEGDDQDGYFHTVAPVIIFQMIDQNLQVTKTISQELTFRALMLSIDQVTQYGRMYREAIVAFKVRHFEDRSQVLYFTHHMITIVNNCLHFVELAQQMKQLYWRPGLQDNEAGNKFEALLTTFQVTEKKRLKIMLKEAFFSLHGWLQACFNLKLITSSILHCLVYCSFYFDYFQQITYLSAFKTTVSLTKTSIEKSMKALMLGGRRLSLTLVYFQVQRALEYDSGSLTTLECVTGGRLIVIYGNQVKVTCGVERFGLLLTLRSSKPMRVIEDLWEVLKMLAMALLSFYIYTLLTTCDDRVADQLLKLTTIRNLDSEPAVVGTVQARCNSSNNGFMSDDICQLCTW